MRFNRKTRLQRRMQESKHKAADYNNRVLESASARRGGVSPPALRRCNSSQRAGKPRPYVSFHLQRVRDNSAAGGERWPNARANCRQNR